MFFSGLLEAWKQGREGEEKKEAGLVEEAEERPPVNIFVFVLIKNKKKKDFKDHSTEHYRDLL